MLGPMVVPDTSHGRGYKLSLRERLATPMSNWIGVGEKRLRIERSDKISFVVCSAKAACHSADFVGQVTKKCSSSSIASQSLQLGDGVMWGQSW